MPAGAKLLKIDERTYDQLLDMAALLGISPDEIAEEALVEYFQAVREQLQERVQKRLDDMFKRTETQKAPLTLPVEEGH